MSTRRCDACGKEKDLRGGKTYSNEHFICKDCVWSGGWFSPRKACPFMWKTLKIGENRNILMRQYS